MGTHATRFDEAYLSHKRLELTHLLEALRKSAASANTEEAEIDADADAQARENEDDAQRLDILEKQSLLIARDVQRLSRVERALQKIAEGTYGFSDLSGAPIPDDRLAVMPDAINTVEEQEASERVR
jgi:DnaK suppressor protein